MHASPSPRRPPPVQKRDEWTRTARTYRSDFRSTSPQRLHPVANREGAPAFDRSGARILGPGSYNPRWLPREEDDRPLSSFVSAIPQRTASRPFTANIDLAHGDGLNSSARLNASIYSTSPGASGQRACRELRT